MDIFMRLYITAPGIEIHENSYAYILNVHSTEKKHMEIPDFPCIVFLGCTVTQLENNSKTIQCMKSRKYNVIEDK